MSILSDDMFFVSITKDEIAQNFNSLDIEEYKINTFIITSIIDNFLSKRNFEKDRFSIIESPLCSSSDPTKIIFSKFCYDNIKNASYISKSLISGRPIYYYINPNGEFFCSTHISIMRIAGVPILENINVLPEFFVYRYVIPPSTLFKDIKQLAAGSQILIKLINGKCKIIHEETYNPPLPSKKDTSSFDIYTMNTLNLLNKSIKLLHPCKNRLAILLSGGLDSSILFKLCQRNYEIDTSYSTGYPFEDPKKNIEREYAESAAESFRTKHYYFSTSTKEYLSGLIEGISKAEEPLHHLQSVMLYLLFKNGLPKNKDIIVLGEGADSGFGPYLNTSIFKSEKFRILSKVPLSHQVLKYASVGRGKAGSLASILYKKDVSIQKIENIVWSLGLYGSIDWSSHYFNVEKNDIIKGRYDCIKKFQNRSIYDIISILSLIGEGSVTQSIWSKLGESQNKILYYPFTNIDILNYIFSISWDLKLKKPKNILRNVARQLNIPDFVITRPKSGFKIDNDIWAKKKGVFEPLVPIASKIFDEKEIRNMQSTEPKKAMIFWNILNYSIWKRLLINNEPLYILLEELKDAN